MSAQGGKNSLASGEVWMGKGESMDTGREEESWQHSNILAFKNNDFSFLNLVTLGKFILLNENPFGFHLWYIGAYLYTLIIVFFSVKCNKFKYIWWSVPFLLLLDLCLGKYSLVLRHKEFPFILVRNFLCVGIPYFSIGMLLKQRQEQILNFKYLQMLAIGGG